MNENAHFAAHYSMVVWWSGHCRLICRCHHFSAKHKGKRKRKSVSRIGESTESADGPKWCAKWTSRYPRSRWGFIVLFPWKCQYNYPKYTVKIYQ